jgi:hypothetical protein
MAEAVAPYHGPYSYLLLLIYTPRWRRDKPRLTQGDAAGPHTCTACREALPLYCLPGGPTAVARHRATVIYTPRWRRDKPRLAHSTRALHVTQTGAHSRASIFRGQLRSLGCQGLYFSFKSALRAQTSSFFEPFSADSSFRTKQDASPGPQYQAHTNYPTLLAEA